MNELRYNFAASRGAKESNVLLRRLGKPVLTVLKWQIAATAALVVVAALMAGLHGALSALAGGLISITAGVAAALVASVGSKKSAGGVVMGALRAEAVKIGLALVLLWLPYH